MPATDNGPRPTCIVVMGPSGVGKTTVAIGLATALGWRFAEADEFHSAENIAKMASGVPLEDEDRWPWLSAIRDWIAEQAAEGTSTVVTCSALKRAYRDVLRGAGAATLRFIYLTGDPAVIAARITARRNHYMPPSLLQSQLAALEPLGEDEGGVLVSVEPPPHEVVADAIDALGLSPVHAASMPAPGATPPAR